MVRTERIIPISYTNLIILIIRLMAVSGAVVWMVYYKPAGFANIKPYVIYIDLFLMYIYIAFFIIRFYCDKRSAIYCLFTFVFDQLVISYFIFNTGGGYFSPFYSGYFITITIAAFVVGLRASLITATAGMIFFTLASIQYGTSLYNWFDMVYRIVPFIMIALPTGILSYKANNFIERIDSLDSKLQIKNKELNESLQTIENMQVQLLEKEREKAMLELTENIAHRIRNPLMSLGGIAAILDKKLKKGVDREELIKYIEHIKQESKKLDKVLVTMLNLSDQTLDLKQLSINNIIESKVIANLMHDIKSSGISLSIQLDHKVPLMQLDEKKISIALSNIIKYYISTMDRGESITIKTHYNENLRSPIVIISMYGSGIGMPEEMVNKLFTPIVEGESKNLDLPIAKRFIEMLGGVLRMTSKVDEGTKFTITLPV